MHAAVTIRTEGGRWASVSVNPEKVKHLLLERGVKTLGDSSVESLASLVERSALIHQTKRAATP